MSCSLNLLTHLDHPDWSSCQETETTLLPMTTVVASLRCSILRQSINNWMPWSWLTGLADPVKTADGMISPKKSTTVTSKKRHSNMKRTWQPVITQVQESIDMIPESPTDNKQAIHDGTNLTKSQPAIWSPMVSTCSALCKSLYNISGTPVQEKWKSFICCCIEEQERDQPLNQRGQWSQCYRVLKNTGQIKSSYSCKFCWGIQQIMLIAGIHLVCLSGYQHLGIFHGFHCTSTT